MRRFGHLRVRGQTIPRGPTGVQGGSVVREVLADAELSKQFRVRGITRNTSKPGAQELAQHGVEMVSANLEDKGSVASALKGANAVFLVTNYWELQDGEREFQEGKLVADLCKAEGIEHFIASTLVSVKDVSHGKYNKVEHFESKHRIEEYARSIGLPATFVMPGFYAASVPHATWS